MVLKFSCQESRFLKMGISLLNKLIKEAKASKDIITLEATVITGFEVQAEEECKEKCKPVGVVKGKGRIFFNIKKDGYPSVFKLRAVDNVFIVNESFETLEFTKNKEKDCEIIKNLVSKLDWEKSVSQWAELTRFEGIQFPECAKKDYNECLANDIKVCQRCLALSKPSEESDNVGVEQNSTAPVENNESPQFLSNSDKKEFFTVPDIDRMKLTVPNEESDDDFHSAEEDCMGDSDKGNLVKQTEIIKCVPDSKLGKEISEDLKDLESPNIIDSKNSEECIITNDVQGGSTNEEKCKDDAVLEMSEEGESVNGTGKNATGDTNSANDNPFDNTKRGKKMGFWKRRREEEKGGKVKKGPKAPPKPYIDDGIIKFRVTCYRNGMKHSFDSNEAAMHFGGKINDEYHWTVDLTRWDINVVLVIEDQSGYVTFALTKESFHRRNISHFGPTTLRATLCYSLIRFAEPVTGDIVIDPMCGGGSISIEGAKGFPKTFHICGDNNEKCVSRTKENILFNTKTEPLNMDAFRWNAKSLPLRDQSVDIVVTDLPFGLRMGKWKDNNALYNAVLRELARVVRSGTGRAALLTYDKAAMIKALRKNAHLWREIRCVMVNHGGIRCVVFLLLRRALVADSNSEKIEKHDDSTQQNTDPGREDEASSNPPEESSDNSPSPLAPEEEISAKNGETREEKSVDALQQEARNDPIAPMN